MCPSVASSAPASAIFTEAAPSCSLGAYLSDLYELDPARNTFAARVWLWTLCPTKELDPLPKADPIAFWKTIGPLLIIFLPVYLLAVVLLVITAATG